MGIAYKMRLIIGEGFNEKDRRGHCIKHSIGVKISHYK